MREKKPAIYKAFIPTPAVEREVLKIEKELGYYSSSALCRAVEVAIKEASSSWGEADYLRALKRATGEFLAEKLEEALGAFGECTEVHVDGSYEDAKVGIEAVVYPTYLTNTMDLHTLYAQYTGFLDEFGHLAQIADVNLTIRIEDSFFTDNEFKEMLEDLIGQETPEEKEKVLSEWLKPTKNHK